MKMTEIVDEVGLTILKIVTVAIFAIGLFSSNQAYADVVGLWEFEDGNNLTSATIGSALMATGSDTAVAGTGTATDSGASSLDNFDFYTVTNSIGGTGGGAETNAYSILMDISTPASGFNALLETDGGDDGDMFLNGAGIGISGDYEGTAADGTYHRILTVYDQAAANNWTYYVDGVEANTAITGEAIDGRWGLGGTFDVFSDNGGGEENTTLVSNLALFDTALTASEAFSLGSAGSTISAVPEPTHLMLLISGMGFVGFRRRK